MREIGRLSGVGLTLVISTLLGFGAGYYLDRWLGTEPWLRLAGLLLGVAAGFVNLFRATGVWNDRRDE
jgi:ATP synthase protein I